jgi:mannan endo-1,4-beta-mannosidase
VGPVQRNSSALRRHSEATGAVIARISEAVRDAELRMWGYTRPQTVSIFGPEPEGDYEELIFRHPCLDFASTHIYHRSGIDRPRDTVVAARTMAQWVRYGLERTPRERPFTDSEHGPIDLFNNSKKMMPEEFDDEYERHMMWAHLASGGAGCGMRWPARHPHVLTTGTRRSIGAMAAFVKQLEWRCFAPRDAVADVEIGTPGFEVFACRDDQQAIVWLLRQAPAGTVESCRSAIRCTMCASQCAAWCRASTRCSCGTRAMDALWATCAAWPITSAICTSPCPS